MIEASIIIPVYNNKKGLHRCLKALSNQCYPKDNFEVIVIDNNSNDNPEVVVNSLQNKLTIHYLEESNYSASPYSARNRGIERSKGEIIVLLDSTCAPVKEWLKSGIKEIKSGADLVGGNVTFSIDQNSSLGEMYDSLSNIRMKETVEQKNAAKTTNLFIRRDVFNKIGLFPEGLRSGGDVRWTHQATKQDLSLVFSPDAEVVMTPRGFRKLVQKQFRVGKGHPKVWQESGEVGKNFFKKIVLFWMPPNPRTLNRWILASNKPFFRKYFIQLFFIGWYLRVVNAAGSVAGLYNLFSQK